MAEPLPALAPDGTLGTIPQAEVRPLERAGGRVMSAAEASAASHRAEVARAPFDPAEAWLSGIHGGLRGRAEAFGLPLDAGITEVAGLFGGDEAKKSTRGYLRQLDERHPLISGVNQMTGQVAGAIAASELTGGYGGAMRMGGVGGAAARAAIGGAENVVAATAHDVNEAALGNAETNGDKLLAEIPKHFVVGAGAGALFEGLGAGAEAGIGALRRRAVPALESAATEAVGREVGGGAAEGARVRGLTDGEIPKSRGAIVDMLSTEQRAIRDRAEGGYASTIEGLERGHAQDIEALGVRHGEGRAAVEASGAHAVREAEGEGADAVLSAMARGGEGVEAAELAGAAKRTEAHGAAAEANWRAAAAERGAGPEATYGRVADAAQGVRLVEQHYADLQASLAEQRTSAEAMVAHLAEERALTARELDTVAAEELSPKEVGNARLARGLREAGLRTEPKPGPLRPHESALVALVEQYFGRSARETFAEEEARGEAFLSGAAAHSESTRLRVERLQALEKDLTSAHADALDHLKRVTETEGKLAFEADKNVAAAGRRADAQIATGQKQASAAAEQAGAHADEALARAKAVEREVEAEVERARRVGAREATKVQKAAEARVVAVQAEAAAAKGAYEKVLARETAALNGAHAEALSAVPKPSKATDVDAMLRVVKRPVEAAPAIPVSTGIAAAFALMHGHPLGAAGALMTSFVASRARAHGNLLLARGLRGLSTRLSAIDEAVRAGAAAVVSGVGGKLARAGVEESTREPSFADVSKRVLDAKANPDIIARHVQMSLGHIAQDAPKTYAATLVAAQRAQAYLETVLPVGQSDAFTLTPHLQKVGVSAVEQREFLDAARVAEHPLSVFEDLQAGSLTEAKADALQAVYPGLHEQIGSEVARQIAALTKPLPYAREMQIGILLGQLTSEVEDRPFQGAMRAAFADKQAGGAPAGSKSKTGDAKVAASMRSAAQKVEQGGEP